jgi:hypothetical protein
VLWLHIRRIRKSVKREVLREIIQKEERELKKD